MKSPSLIALLITNGCEALLGLLIAFGVPLTTEQVAAIMVAVGFIGVVASLILWSRTVDKGEVLERLVGEVVVAGEANDQVPNGSAVRTLNSDPPRRLIGA